jgi:hypothetical protein
MLQIIKEEAAMPIADRRFAFNVTQATADAVLEACERLGQPICVFLRRAIERHLAEVEAPAPKRQRASAHDEQHHPTAA